MLKRSSKCLNLNKLFSYLVFYIFLQNIPTIFTYNDDEDFDIEFEPVEKVDMLPYIYPIVSFLNLSGINVIPERIKKNLDLKPTFPIETNNLTGEIKKLKADSSTRFKEQNLNESQETKESSSLIQSRSEILKDDEEKNENFLMKLFFNFYFTPILTSDKPLLDEEVKYYKNLFNVSKQLSNDTRILSKLLDHEIINKDNDTNGDYGIFIKINDTQLTDPNLSSRITAVPNVTDSDKENNPVFQIIPRWKEIFKLSLKDETKSTTSSKVETTNSSDNFLKEAIFSKPIKLPTTTEQPKLSFTNNTAILALFKPGEIPRINIKKDSNSGVSFKIKVPIIDNNTDENNHTHDGGTYVFNTTPEFPSPENSSSSAQEISNSVRNFSDLQVSTTSNTSTSSNESDIVQSRTFYSSEGSMIPGMLEITTTTSTLPPLSIKVAPRDHYKSRMKPTFSSRYSANSTTSKAAIETLVKNETKNISTTNTSLINSSINDTSALDKQEVENATQSNLFINISSSVNPTTASVSEKTTLIPSTEIKNGTKIEMNARSLRKRELPFNDQYDVNDRQELASYFYNGKKIHESYLNYINSIDHEFPQDFVQYQDKFSGKPGLSSLENEVMYEKRQDNFPAIESSYNFQPTPALSSDYLFPNSNLKSNVEKKVSISPKNTTTMGSVKKNNKTINRKNKKSHKNISNRTKVNSKRKNTKNGKLKKKTGKLSKGKKYSNLETGKRRIATNSNHKNKKVQDKRRKKTRSNRLMKNKKKISNQVRSKKKNTHKQNDKTRFRDVD